jgi:predicted anti-sigma-YlaC factor YlaD
MRCDEAQAALSARLDAGDTAEADGPVDAHVAGCAECQGFEAGSHDLRRRLRLQVVDGVPDVAEAVRAQLTGAPRVRPRRALVGAAAAFVVAVLAATGLAWVSGGSDEAVAAIPERVLVAQRELSSLDAEVTVVERGWHPDVPVRHLAGHLTYAAPESLALRLPPRGDEQRRAGRDRRS